MISNKIKYYTGFKYVSNIFKNLTTSYLILQVPYFFSEDYFMSSST